MVPDPNFQTPLPVVDYMVSLVPYSARTVLEPCPGLGNIVGRLQQAEYQVTAPGDFFLLDKRQRYDSIVMNPPFSGKSAHMEHAPVDAEKHGMKVGYYILKECMKMSDSVIALMPWFTLTDSDVRLRDLQEFGMRSVTSLPRKTFGYARIQTCIIELDKGFKGDTTFKVFRY
jgi:type I restriction-modification system DNA methylase subunit